MAALAGIDFDVGLSLEYLTGQMHGYNDGIKNLSKEVLKNIQDFEVSEAFFDDKKSAKVRAFENTLQQEPYVLQESKSQYILLKHCFDIPHLQKALKEELTFEKFVEMKNQWL